MLSDTIVKAIMEGCCKKNKCIQKLTAKEIKKWREPFWSMSETKRREFLLNAFALDMYHEGQKRKYCFSIKGKPVCYVAWYKALRISHTWYVHIIK